MTRTTITLHLDGPDLEVERAQHSILQAVAACTGNPPFDPYGACQVTIEPHAAEMEPVLSRLSTEFARPVSTYAFSVEQYVPDRKISIKLMREGLYYLSQVSQFTTTEILGVSHLGPARRDALIELMAEQGIKPLEEPLELSRRDWAGMPARALKLVSTHHITQAKGIMSLLPSKIRLGEFVGWTQANARGHAAHLGIADGEMQLIEAVLAVREVLGLT